MRGPRPPVPLQDLAWEGAPLRPSRGAAETRSHAHAFTPLSSHTPKITSGNPQTCPLCSMTRALVSWVTSRA